MTNTTGMSQLKDIDLPLLEANSGQQLYIAAVNQNLRRCFCFVSTDGTYTLYNDMIYLLTAIGLSPGGSTHLHTNNK